MLRAFLPLFSACAFFSVLAFSEAFPFDRSRADICADIASGKTPPNTINVRSAPIGAKGDGKSDDYAAFAKLASQVSGGRAFPKTAPRLVVIPAGTYFLNQHKVTCTTSAGIPQNEITDIIFQNFSNVRIVGCGQPVIKVKGDFSRTIDYDIVTLPDGSRYGNSCENSVTPFYFRWASQFALEGITLDGSVGQTQRENVNEGGSNGIVTGAVSGARFSDIEVHHFGSDGMYLGLGKLPGLTVGQADRNIIIERMNSHHNARQGLTIVQARTVLVRDSFFTNTGRTENSRYPGFEPMAGVDVEPNHSPYFGNYRMDVTSGDITFDTCHFWYNLGSQFSAQTGADRVASSILENVRVLGRRSECELTSENPQECPLFNKNRSDFVTSPDSSPNAVVFSVPNGVMDKTRVQTHANGVWAFWGGAWNTDKNPSLRMEDTFIVASGMGKAVIDRANHGFSMSRSRIYVNVPNTQVPIDIRNDKAVLTSNKFFFNGTGLVAGAPPVNMANFLVKEVNDNRYYFNSVNDPDSGVQINYFANTKFTREAFYTGPFRLGRETKYDAFALSGIVLQGLRSYFTGFSR